MRTISTELRTVALKGALIGLCVGSAAVAEPQRSTEPQATEVAKEAREVGGRSPHAGTISSMWGPSARIAAWSARRLVALPRDERPDRKLLEYLKEGPHPEVCEAILSGPHGTGFAWSLPAADVEAVLLGLLDDERLLARTRVQLIVLYATRRELDPMPFVEHLTTSLARAREPVEQARDLMDLIKLTGAVDFDTARRNPALVTKVIDKVMPLLPALAQSPEHYVRYDVAKLLGRLPAEHGLPLALQMLRSEQSPDPTDKLLGTLHTYALGPLDRPQREQIREAILRVASDRRVKRHIRWDAVRALIGLGHERLAGDLIGLLRTDGEPDEDIMQLSDGPRPLTSVDTEAVAALVKLTGRDFGFDPAAPREERAAAARRWVEWWRGE